MNTAMMAHVMGVIDNVLYGDNGERLQQAGWVIQGDFNSRGDINLDVHPVDEDEPGLSMEALNMSVDDIVFLPGGGEVTKATGTIDGVNTYIELPTEWLAHAAV